MPNTIRGGRLTKENITKLTKSFKWSAFTIGQTRLNITKTGGVHFSGESKLMKAVSIEIPKNKTYIVINLFEYPKGVLFHPFIPFNNVIDKTKLEDSIQEIMKITKKCLLPEDISDET